MSLAASARLAAVTVELKYSAPLEGYGHETVSANSLRLFTRCFRVFPRVPAWKVSLTQTLSDVFMLFMFRFVVVYVMQVRSVLGNRPHVTTSLVIVACLIATVMTCCTLIAC